MHLPARLAEMRWPLCGDKKVGQSAAKVVSGKKTSVGGDLATAHGRTQWLGVATIGSLFAARHAKIPLFVLNQRWNIGWNIGGTLVAHHWKIGGQAVEHKTGQILFFIVFRVFWVVQQNC